MSCHVLFALSSGLAKPVRCPKGTFAAILAHVQEVEKTLGLTVTQYQGNPPHWDHWKMDAAFASVSDQVLCDTVQGHNAWVYATYKDFAGWFKKPLKGKGAETITPARAKQFWYGLETLEVKPDRWTPEYYQAEMERLYEAMRGREAEGISFDAAALTAEQANSVICLFSQFLDTHDIRLEVPKAHDHLETSDEYEWCTTCGAVDSDEVIRGDDVEDETRTCPFCQKEMD